MSGYILKQKKSDGSTVNVPLAATYDAAGNDITSTYATKKEYQDIMDKLGVMDRKLDTILGATSLTLASWELINTASAMGIASALWKVGDEKVVELTTGEKITMVILGFNHDNLTTGGKAGITFGTKNCPSEGFAMSTSSNALGWKNSTMRLNAIPVLFRSLPGDLRGVIKYVDKKTSTGGSSVAIDTVSDNLFLFSLEEVMGTTNLDSAAQGSVAGEGSQYEYFRNAPIPKPIKGTAFSELAGTGCFYTSNTSSVTGYINRFGESKSTFNNTYYNYNNAKTSGNTSNSATEWWLRSPYYGSTATYCTIAGGGQATMYPCGDVLDFAFGFCV